jgi:hypothetical protein
MKMNLPAAGFDRKKPKPIKILFREESSDI